MKRHLEGVCMIRNDDELRSFYCAETPVSHPSDAQLLDWITRIRAGERGAEIDGIARYIIKDFCLRQFLGIAQSPITLEWVANSLSQIIDYADPLQTLGLVPRPNSRPPDTQQGIDISWWVAITIKRGYKKAQAIQAAAELFAKDESVIRRACNKNQSEWMNPDDRTWDEYFQHLKRPLPPAKLGN